MPNKKQKENRVTRNRQKFYMKYGFDLIKYVDMISSAYTEEEITSKLNILPQQLEHFKNDQQLKNLKSKRIL